MRDLHFPGRSVVMSTRAMAATSQPMATAAALDVLQRGGNAMDAAVAASATLAVTEPQSTGIGGDCFLLYYEAKSGELYGLNGSGRAPARATVDAYRRRGYTEVPESGIHAATVPGAVHAWETALARFGSRGLDEMLAPAIRYAEQGYAVTPVVASAWQRNRDHLARFPDSRRTLLIDGEAPAAGAIHRQPDLARTLRSIARDGAETFYRGAIAEALVRFSDANDGLFGTDDFAAHESTWVSPIGTDYAGHRLYELPPNGQGITALLMLNVLKRARLAELEHLGCDHVHLFAEAYKLAVAERDRFVSDPEASELPVADLLSESFAERQHSRIDMQKALGIPVRSGMPEHKDTVYLSVVDENRNMVSFINSTCYSFGCGMVAGDTGIVLQNRAVGFNLEEGSLRCIAPGRRPMHTIIPAMVYRDTRPVLAYGVMGGHYQPMGHSYVLSNWLDFGMDLQEAIDAPRFLPEDGALGVERGVSHAVRDALSRRGHRVVEAENSFGGAQMIQVDWDTGLLQGASEPRKDGCALGF